jgi:hypothetical protein
MLALTHADEKANANSALNKQSQNSSYKVQLLHAAVVLQSGSNRLRSLGAASVNALQNSCWPSRTPTKTQTRIQRLAAKTQPHNKKTHKVQYFHSADLARSHARRKRNAIRM